MYSVNADRKSDAVVPWIVVIKFVDETFVIVGLNFQLRVATLMKVGEHHQVT